MRADRTTLVVADKRTLAEVIRAYADFRHRQYKLIAREFYQELERVIGALPPRAVAEWGQLTGALNFRHHLGDKSNDDVAPMKHYRDRLMADTGEWLGKLAESAPMISIGRAERLFVRLAKAGLEVYWTTNGLSVVRRVRDPSPNYIPDPGPPLTPGEIELRKPTVTRERAEEAAQMLGAGQGYVNRVLSESRAVVPPLPFESLYNRAAFDLSESQVSTVDASLDDLSDLLATLKGAQLYGRPTVDFMAYRGYDLVWAGPPSMWGESSEARGAGYQFIVVDRREYPDVGLFRPGETILCILKGSSE